MFIALSLFTVYLFLAGYASASFLMINGRRCGQVALALGTGILVNYGLMLTGLSLTAVLIAGGVVALGGLWRFARDVRRLPPAITGEHRSRVFPLLCMSYILGIYYVQVLSEPLLRWDARSVWFFKARMIWAAGAFRRRTGWEHPSVDFSSPDYPNLIPGLAAQLAHFRGYWNEFLPKGSLVLLLLPLVLWVFSFQRKALSFLLLVLLFFFSLHAWLWNGYMDAYLTMYAAVALLSFGRYASDGQEADLYSGICALGIAASLKNEGLLFAAATVMAVILVGIKVPVFGVRQLLARARSDRVFLIVIALSLAPIVLWGILKSAWGLQNHVTANLPGGLARLSARLSDGVTVEYVFTFLTRRASVAWVWIGLVVAAGLFSRWQRFRLHPGAVIAATTSLLYLSALLFIYLITPTSVTWHLMTSATRTMATVSFGLLVSLFFLLRALEE